MGKFRRKKKCNVHFSGINPVTVDAPRHFPLINRGWGSEGPRNRNAPRVRRGGMM